jgi:uncharacterized RmlC-like cupin family protein
MVVKTPDVTPEQMEKRVARFSTLQPSKKSFTEQNVGIPGEAYELLAAKNVYVLLAPEGNKRSAAKPAVVGAPGIEVVIAECPPGQGPAMHAHCLSHEIFLCMTGRYEIIWGDKGEHSIVLEPFDLIAIPPGVFRRFRNISDLKDARLLAIVQGDKDDVFNDVKFDPAIGDVIVKRWGKAVWENFKNIGITFEAPDPKD